MEELRKLKNEMEELLGERVLLTYVIGNEEMGWNEQVTMIAGKYRICIEGFDKERCSAKIQVRGEKQLSTFYFRGFSNFANIFKIHYKL